MKTARPIYYEVFDSAFGEIELIWSDQPEFRIIRVFLSDPKVPAHAKQKCRGPVGSRKSSPALDHLIGDMQRFLKGEDVVFDLGITSLEYCPPFQQKVLQAEHAIPRGYISSYGRIAQQVGMPGGAQQVGRALATNPFPLIIPCHRAVAADGGLSGFQGGVEMKRALLEMEGVHFDARGLVVMDQVWYE